MFKNKLKVNSILQQCITMQHFYLLRYNFIKIKEFIFSLKFHFFFIHLQILYNLALISSHSSDCKEMQTLKHYLNIY